MFNVIRSSISLSIRTHSRALRHDLSRSTNYHRDQMVEDTANILATMVKARRTIFNTNLLSEQVECLSVKSRFVIEFELGARNVCFTKCKSIPTPTRVTMGGQNKETFVGFLFLFPVIPSIYHPLCHHRRIHPLFQDVRPTRRRVRKRSALLEMCSPKLSIS